jgi:hypothetical protein
LAQLDEQLTFTLRLTNIANRDVLIIAPVHPSDTVEDLDRIRAGDRAAAFFLQVEPLTLDVYGIFPVGLPATQGPADDLGYRVRLSPDEVYSAEWRGSFRNVLNGLVVPHTNQQAGEYRVRATYMGRCSPPSIALLCNSVTSDWVRLQIQE